MTESDTAKRPRLAYLTSSYPNVSHTFIRREILELEAQGYSVLRMAIRRSEAVVDPADRAEQEKTYHCLEHSLPGLVVQAKLSFLSHPVRAMRAIAMTYAMHRNSERGLIRHLAYLIEAGAILRVLARERIDHVHVHFGTNPAAVARLVRCLGGPPYSMTVHGPDEFDAPIGLSLGAKIEDSAFTVAISHYCASQLRRWVDYRHWSKIYIVHCNLGDTWFEESDPIPTDSETLVCVGRLSGQKGQLLLVDAFAKAHAACAKGQLVLVGDGEMREAVEERIAAHNIQRSVTITGWQTEAEVRAHLLQARALVLASFAEGLPVVIMEALALRRPVIATAIAGIPELVKDGEHGWIAIAGDVDGLAEALKAALEAPVQALDAMGAKGHERTRERHHTATEVSKLARLFDKYSGG